MNMRFLRLALGFLILVFSNVPSAQSRATWIWYPGDFEIRLSNQMQARRTERDASMPPVWRLYSPQVQVSFTRRLDLEAPEEVTVEVEGSYNLTIDGKIIQGDQRRVLLPAGKHVFNIQVYNPAAPPAVFVQGKTVHSDASWTVGAVPPNYAAPAAPALQAGSWNLDAADQPPSRYKLATREIQAAGLKRGPHSILVDFGQETIGFVKLRQLKGSGKVSLYYGESVEEALAIDACETFDKYNIRANNGDFIADRSRALRYVNIAYDEGISVDDVSLLYEYLPLQRRGAFKSSDEELNKVWEVALRSLELNTREFFVDGIKRDHWVWSGDAL